MIIEAENLCAVCCHLHACGLLMSSPIRCLHSHGRSLKQSATGGSHIRASQVWPHLNGESASGLNCRKTHPPRCCQSLRPRRHLLRSSLPACGPGPCPEPGPAPCPAPCPCPLPPPCHHPCFSPCQRHSLSHHPCAWPWAHDHPR